MSVRIFGQHDEATVAQIHRCLAVGGARGVLCADGHKGYAQPIGGVIAYRDLDEAPQAYRRLPEVLAAHAGTIRLLHTLTPIGVAMAGHDIYDPYKD
jgi:tRNA-splicing ligase RtcB